MNSGFTIKLVAGVIGYGHYGPDSFRLINDISDILPYKLDNDFVLTHRYIIYSNSNNVEDNYLVAYCQNSDDIELIKRTGKCWMIYYKSDDPVVVPEFSDWLEMYERKKNEF